MKAMQTATAGSVEEYLARSYRPDREYIDGTILERHLGDRDHSEVQTEIATYLNSRRKQLGIRVFVEQRIQVAPSRFRIPDICVTVGPRPQELVLTRPPFVCIEILSKDDRPSDTRERVEELLGFRDDACLGRRSENPKGLGATQQRAEARSRQVFLEPPIPRSLCR